MGIQDTEMKRLLVEGDFLTEKQFDAAASDAKERGVELEKHLIDTALISDEHFGAMLASYFGIRFMRLSRQKIEDSALGLVPEAFARAHNLLPVAQTQKSVTVATSQPDDVSIKSLLEKHLRRQVVFAYATPKDVANHLFLFQKDPKSAIEHVLTGINQEKGSPDTTVIKLVDTILSYAYQGGASDVHIEPENEYSVVRFRVDGLLHDIIRLPIGFHEKIITRLKVLARLATDQHRAAQDGKVIYKSVWGDEVEVRLSIIPTTREEKAVMRLLSDKSHQFSLADLGLGDEDFKTLLQAIQSPWGMILVTGPTGSGKTTTLYSILKILNERDVNITTIEDPVEYDLEGVNQTQVNEKTGMTFAKGLRSLVRQDPDIIMVGEIRDKETADISVNAAMTGHLVLSTLHTNDAATAFPRLQDMGIEDFLISSTAQIVIAQRLIRKICTSCIASAPLTQTQEQMFDRLPEMKGYLKEITKKASLDQVRWFSGKGCSVCHDTGYFGRIGIFEILKVDDAVRTAIMEKRNADDIKAIAVKAGMKTMLYDGLGKAVMGLTTVEEVLRATRE